MRVGESTRNKFCGPARSAACSGGIVLQAMVAIAIIALGGVSVFTLVKMRKEPLKVAQDPVTPLVKVETLVSRDIKMVINGYGTVNPKVRVEIIPEVSGKVVSVNPELKVGGLIAAGEQVLQIDPRDYELAVQQGSAAVAEAKVRLETELAEAEVAKIQWEQLHPGTEPASPLVFREPQIRQARAAVESASAQLATAQLRLERTRVSLPFDALIVSETVDVGQYIVMGQPLATAYGIEAVEIEVPLEDQELAWFDVFGKVSVYGGAAGSGISVPAVVRAEFAGREHTWQGTVVRTTGQVDRTSRMVSVVVEVAEPFTRQNGRPPLLPGVFAQVSIEGRSLKNAFAIPRDAIHEGDKVWLVNDGHLLVKSVDVVRADRDFAYTTADLGEEPTIVVSSLDTVVENMEVRTQSGVAGVEGQSERNEGAADGSEAN